MAIKSFTGYSIISSISASLIAYSVNFITDNTFTIYWILSAVFLMFGVIHLIIVYKKSPPDASNGKVMLQEIVLGIVIVFIVLVIFFSLEYFLLKNREYLFYPVLLSSLAFFIPALSFHTFNTAVDIPAAIFKTWTYPLNQQIALPDESPSERIYVIGFEIAKKNYDVNKTYFRARAPEGMKLGELYYHFINDYNELQSETPIQYVSTDSNSYEWWFRRKPKWYQSQHIFNPEITIRENGIKENTIIICERIKVVN